MTVRLTMVCEAPADFETAARFADRLVCESVDWISCEVIDSYREWRGWREVEAFLLWRDVPDLARRFHVQPRGHFAGRPGDLDAYAARRALALLLVTNARPAAVFLVRDSDGLLERRSGLEQARAAIGGELTRVIIGVAHTKRECWILAGFVPQNAVEEGRLAELRAELGFDPTAHGERLTARHEQDKKSAKRVLNALTANDRNRERECVTQTAMSILDGNGVGCGLSGYMKEIRTRLLSLFGGK